MGEGYYISETIMIYDEVGSSQHSTLGDMSTLEFVGQFEYV